LAFLTFSDLDRGGSLDASSKAMWRNPSIGRHASISHIPPDRICPAKGDRTLPIPLHTSAVVTRVARGFSALLVGALWPLVATLVHADTVSDWNQTAIDVMKVASVAGNPWSRTLAMVHVAMSDAINSVQGRYTRCVVTVPAVPGASAEAAAAAAARHLLVQLYPNQKAMVDEAYVASLKAVPEGAAKSEGIGLGEQVSSTVRADRSADGTNVPDTYRPLTSPGVWVPTPPPLFEPYARATPWVLKSADQFRPTPPPPLSSALYARDYNETKNLGGTKSTARTPEQTEAVKF
jgi:hypothetical protein